MNIFCKLGWHKRTFSEKWLPSFEAKIVEEVILKEKCIRCPWEEVISHLIWDYETKDWTEDSF